MSKFKVGDRVRVYGGISEGPTGRYVSAGYRPFTVAEVFPSGKSLMSIVDDEGCYYSAHPRQCRRIVRKERRRVWVCIDNWADSAQRAAYGEDPRKEFPDYKFREFIEVKPKRGGK